MKRLSIFLSTLVVVLPFFRSPCHALTNPKPPENIVILGFGRVGSEVARQARTWANTMVGTVRRKVTAKDEDDRCRGIPYSETEGVLEAVRGCTHLLVTIPPTDEVDDAAAVPNAFFDQVVAALPNERGGCWIGVVSTTGVYGNHDGDWVTEESECRATSPSARRYLAYEAAWIRRATPRYALHIFRCAGIYGGLQSALHTIYKSGLPTFTSMATGKDVTNRIHVVDLAAAVVASMQQHDASIAGTTHMYNLADDLPESRTVVMEYAVELLHSINVTVLGAASTEPESSSVRGRRRHADAKRVSNDKMKRELLHGISLRYPTYKEGLQAMLHDPSNPWWPQHESDH
jgi:nucleoside-diphosphate-sugar epimerase